MSETTDIGWADSTVNPVMGCDGCELWNDTLKECYAGKLTGRYAGYSPGYPAAFDQVTQFPGRMAKAAKWKDLRGVARKDKHIPSSMPRLVFISDMGDALSNAISFDYLKTEIVDVVRGWPHIGLWLTKRPKRMAEFSKWLGRGNWPSNLWAGTSITSQSKLHRAQELLQVRAPIHFLSCEPLFEKVSMFETVCAGCGRLGCGSCPAGTITMGPSVDGRKIDWVIVGGASGSGLPDCGVDAICDLANQCREASVPVFVKQDYAPKPGQQGGIPADIWSLKQFPALP